jgi:hypothetical protein
MADSTQPQTDWGNLLGTGVGALANYWGNSNATNALTGGEQNGINTQTGTQGQLTDIYGPQRGLGSGADVALASQLGLAGTPNYSAFSNSPGYQFARAQGSQAIDRTAAANGSLYTPNTLAMLDQYNTGYASQNYNNYIGQLMQSAGLGAQGNQGLASGITSTGANISQLQQNQGNAQAGGQANASGITSNLISKVPWGQVANGASNWWNSGGTGGGIGGNANGLNSQNNYGSADYSGSGTMYNSGGTPDTTSTDSGTSTYWGDNSNPS